MAEPAHDDADALMKESPRAEAICSVDLGDLRANPTFSTLRISFDIEPDRADSRPLDEVDTQAGETSHALRNLLRQIEFIRKTRDRLHAELMKWGDILAAWQGMDAEPSPRTHKLVRDTYRFVARYFPAESEWVR